MLKNVCVQNFYDAHKGCYWLNFFIIHVVHLRSLARMCSERKSVVQSDCEEMVNIAQ